MTEDLTKRILQFLEIETNYAVIISGDYGIGKTFYFKDRLFPLVRDITVPNSEKEEKYRPILISLFGMKSVEEIQKQIFLELYPLLKTKEVKIASDIAKSLLKVFSGFDVDKYVGDANTSSSDIINYNKLLLCFDDFDRKSDDLKINELFGFINNLVENSNTKVIIIANENELRKEDFDTSSVTYSVLREKVIGISIKFNSDVPNIYNQIINSKYKSSLPDYFKYLDENSQNIISIIEQNGKNIRNLVFFLEHFKIIFESLDEFLKNDPNLNTYRKEIFELILNFTLPISIEYKMGALKPKNFEDIKDLYTRGLFNLLAFLNDESSSKVNSKGEKIESYQKIYKKKYLDDNIQRRKIYFESIFDYITGTSSFSIDKLIDELKSTFVLEENKVPKRELLLNKLSYWQFIDLNISEYRKLTNEMLSFVDKSEYKLDQYTIVFHYATRFNNILNYNIENLKRRFKKGIKKGAFEYKSNLRPSIPISSGKEFYDELQEIARYCTQTNKEIEIKLENERIENLLKLFQSDFMGFLEKINESNTEFKFLPIFDKFNFNKFWNNLKKAKNSEQIEFSYVIARRYTKGFYPELNQEKQFLEQLKEKLEVEIGKSRTTKMDKIAYKFLATKVVESINNFK